MNRLIRMELITGEAIRGSLSDPEIRSGPFLFAVSSAELRRHSLSLLRPSIIGFCLGVALSAVPDIILAWNTSTPKLTFMALLIASALGTCLGLLLLRSNRFILRTIPKGSPSLQQFAGTIDSSEIGTAHDDRGPYSQALAEKFRKQGLRVP